MGNNGEVAGFIDAALYDSGERFPALDLESSESQIHGLEVTDERGELVGYFVEELGFVDLATATEPASLDAAYAAMREQTQMSEAELQALLKDARPRTDMPPG